MYCLDFTTGIFIDNSGSTCSQLISIGKNVLQAELSICQATQFNHIILWNSSAQLCTSIQSAKSEGGTDPKAIFQNKSTENAFNASDVIVFVTDGEINNSDVTQVKRTKKMRIRIFYPKVDYRREFLV
jgi:hypothetical protein